MYGSNVVNPGNESNPEEENDNGGEEIVTNFDELRSKLRQNQVQDEVVSKSVAKEASGEEGKPPSGEEAPPPAIEAQLDEGEGGEPPPGVGPNGKKIPVYLLDEEPTGESNWVKWMLMHGANEEDLVNIHGKNSGTVRICAQELERDGHRKRPSKLQKGSSTAVAKTGQRGLRTFAQGSPPETIVEAISLPLDGPQAKIFENGLKSGALLVILGVRVAQELSAIGIQQAKPIMEMARSMREGEAIAAKSAASEAADEAAMKVSRVFAPHLDQLENTIVSLSKDKGGGDPLQQMVVDMFQPMMQNMMKMFMPNLQFGQQAPSGWEVVQE